MAWDIQVGNTLDLLRRMPDRSVQCIVTSPPYWGLRDYKIPATIWAGKDNCRHKWVTERVERELPRGINLKASKVSTRGGGKKIAKVGHVNVTIGTCLKCGAWKGNYGLEPTIALYLKHTKIIFAELKRVLRDDGTLWLNLGDSYANDYKWGGETGGKQAYLPDNDRKRCGREKRKTGLKAKDLVGMPWRVALMLQAEGWYLRRDIIWAKDNPMPESVTDRPTTAHEYVFLLTKKAHYFYDAIAVREASSANTHARSAAASELPGAGSRFYVDRVPGRASSNVPKEKQNESFSAAVVNVLPYRNLRSVWRIATEPFPEAHFATFPTELPRICILAGTSEHGCCADCRAPYVRIVEGQSAAAFNVRLRDDQNGRHEKHGYRPPSAQAAAYDEKNYNGKYKVNDDQDGLRRLAETREKLRAETGRHDACFPGKQTVGWAPAPTCKCDAAIIPCTVLDPFSGAGTTVLVAVRHGRNGLGFDLNPEYAAMSRNRILNDAPLLNTASEVEIDTRQQSLFPEVACPA